MRVRLEIEGMSCEGCVRSVERVLQAVDKVQKVQVEIGKAEAEVAEGLDPGELVRAVEDLGYSVRAVHTEA